MAARELIALQTAFYGGHRIRPGQSFIFDGEKIPKWAAEPGTKLPAAKKMGDTKPVAARRAAVKKQADVSGGDDPVV